MLTEHFLLHFTSSPPPDGHHHFFFKDTLYSMLCSKISFFLETTAVRSDYIIFQLLSKAYSTDGAFACFFFNKTRDPARQYYLLVFWKNARLFPVGRTYLPPAY